jgi:hypothetical protein
MNNRGRTSARVPFTPSDVAGRISTCAQQIMLTVGLWIVYVSRRSHSAYEPNNEHNDQNGSKNAADIHVLLREFR